MVKFNKNQIISDEEEENNIKELRKLLLNKIENGDDSFFDGVHPDDLKRINHDSRWLYNFVLFNDYNVKESLNQCWNTLEWRKNYGANDISEDNVRSDYLSSSHIYIRGRDKDEKVLLFFRVRVYLRGNKTIENLKRLLIYWVERAVRESNGDKITIVFDLYKSGMKNVDMEFLKAMINFMIHYYPNLLNYLLVYDMPWIMNGLFQIIKGLLPKKVVDRMKFINSKNVQQYISDENMPSEWPNGKDNYELKFEPQVRTVNGCEKKDFINNNDSNNNDDEHENLNLTQRKKMIEALNDIKSDKVMKVHFAQSESSPMSEISSSSYENHYGDMLQITPAETILFQKNSNNEYAGNVEILNISKKAITYKVKTTAPDKFRVRPSSGTLSPNNSVTINVVIQKNQHTLPINKDKFLVMCMALPEGESQTNDEIANMWKEITAASPEVEQHRLKCTMPANVTTAIINNNLEGISDYFVDGSSGMNSPSSIIHSVSHNGTKQSSSSSSHNQQHHLQVTVNQLSDCVTHMQQQVKTLQSLQWITIFVFIMLSIAIVYILKMEIQNSNSQYCIDK